MKDYRCKAAKVWVIKSWSNRYLLQDTGNVPFEGMMEFNVYDPCTGAEHLGLPYTTGAVKQVSINELTDPQRRVYDSNPSKFRC